MSEILFQLILFVIQLFGVLLCADFVSGVVHWLEDSYGNPSWPLIGQSIIAPNIEHHHHPRSFTKGTFWSRNFGLMILSGLILSAVYLLGWFDWKWVFFAGIGSVANEIHCWAHRSPRENGSVIGSLQKIGILQSAKAHAIHHTDPKDRGYCTVTNYLNPILDRLRFFERIERMLFRLLSIRRRVDPSVRLEKAA